MAPWAAPNRISDDIKSVYFSTGIMAQKIPTKKVKEVMSLLIWSLNQVLWLELVNAERLFDDRKLEHV